VARTETPAPDDPRPWERPGAVRRDCAPHRGNLLRQLGRASGALGVLSMVLVLPALVSIALGVAVCLLARHDLAQMRAGLMDPSGQDDTEVGYTDALCGLLFSLGPLVLVLLVLLATLARL
jgi:hypothetical protein